MGQLVVSAIVLACLYALLAIGYVLVYRASRLLNFAHGDMMMVGAYLAYTIASLTGGQALVSIAGGVVLSFLSGALIYYLMMRPILGQPVYTGVIATMGLSILLQGAATLIWSTSLRYLDSAWHFKTVVHHLPFDVAVTELDAYTVAAAIIITGGLMMFLRLTPLGVRMLATADEPLLAAQRGININLMFAMAWSIATLAATIAGVLYGATRAMSPAMGTLGLQAFPAAVVGGMTSLVGVLPGALLIAIIEVVTMRYLDPKTAVFLPMLVLLLVLIVRPWGLFGRAEEIERV